MAALDESPVGSPLSDLSSNAFEVEEDHDRLAAESRMPPAKRQKRGDSSLRATPAIEDFGFISSDTDGEIPNTPNNIRPEEDDTHEQVTVCAWVDCEAGDLGDMDKLVEHIHNEHIETKLQSQRKYTCEWSDCSRRGTANASAYALKAHMRSHTREKPFYCALPECDRAFTRSDALAKHMRTVHETEALRPSDPVPKSTMHPIIKSRFKFLDKPASSQNGASQTQNVATNGNEPSGWASSFPAELGFISEEEARGSKELFELLRRQIHWAEEEGELLRRQCDQMEALRKKEWLDKEVLLDQVIKNEGSWYERRQEIIRIQKEQYQKEQYQKAQYQKEEYQKELERERRTREEEPAANAHPPAAISPLPRETNDPSSEKPGEESTSVSAS